MEGIEHIIEQINYIKNHISDEQLLAEIEQLEEEIKFTFKRMQLKQPKK
jgi:hypothetical protein